MSAARAFERVPCDTLNCDRSTRGASNHPPCPVCHSNAAVMRCTNLDSRGSSAFAPGSTPPPNTRRYYRCDADRPDHPVCWVENTGPSVVRP